MLHSRVEVVEVLVVVVVDVVPDIVVVDVVEVDVVVVETVLVVVVLDVVVVDPLQVYVHPVTPLSFQLLGLSHVLFSPELFPPNQEFKSNTVLKHA
jgi:hypothetical protein